jgi:hypothetical protein
MEKSDRRGKRQDRCRLLSILLFSAFALAGLPALEADLSLSSFEITAGNPVTLTVTVRGSDPAVTSLEFPDLPSSFTETSRRKELVRSSSPLHAQTADATRISIEWIPAESGSFALGPFTVRTDRDSVTLPQVFLSVKQAPLAAYAALRWRVPAVIPETGEPLRIFLEASFSGEPRAVRCPAPENALLTGIPLDRIPDQGQEPGWRLVAAYNWVPLEGGEQQLPRAVLDCALAGGGTRTLVSEPRAVLVSVKPALPQQNPVPRSLRDAFGSPPGDSGKPPVSALPAPATGLSAGMRLPPGWKEGDWRKGSYASILRDLRQAEYDSLFPSSVRSSRLAFEADLGLEDSIPVPPAAWKPVAVIGSVLLLCAAALLRLAGLRIPFLRVVASALLVPALLLALFAVSVYTRDRIPSGGSTGGDVLHVPEAGATVVDALREGVAVHIEKRAGDWLYVGLPSGLHGWVQADSVLDYTAQEHER